MQLQHPDEWSLNISLTLAPFSGRIKKCTVGDSNAWIWPRNSRRIGELGLLYLKPNTIRIIWWVLLLHRCTLWTLGQCRSCQPELSKFHSPPFVSGWCHKFQRSKSRNVNTESWKCLYCCISQSAIYPMSQVVINKGLSYQTAQH